MKEYFIHTILSYSIKKSCNYIPGDELIGYFCVKSIRVNTLQSEAEIPADVKISVAQA